MGKIHKLRTDKEGQPLVQTREDLLGKMTKEDEREVVRLWGAGGQINRSKSTGGNWDAYFTGLGHGVVIGVVLAFILMVILGIAR
jgi:hypothetical protein